MSSVSQGLKAAQHRSFTRGTRPKRPTDFTPYVFIAPNMVLFLAFMVIPLLFTFYIGFHRWDILGKAVFIGLRNYLDLSEDKLFWLSIANTAYYTFATVPPIMAFALLFAILLNRGIKLKTFFRGALYIPSVISYVVIAMIWRWIFSTEYGILDFLLGAIGLQGVDWLNDPSTAMIPIIVTTLWCRIGYNLVIYLAGLQNIPETYYEASVIDGANKWQQFRYVTFPLLRTTNIFVLSMAVIWGFRSFDLIYVMTRGGPAGSTTTMVQYIYQLAFQVGKMGKASALSIILFIIIVTITLLELRVGDRKNG
jgi:multiple sugar transport system permease protein